MEDSDITTKNKIMKNRFRGYLPVVVDVETAGFNSETDALLEIAAVLLAFDDNKQLIISETIHEHVKPHPNTKLNKESLEFTGIKPFNPFRFAKGEKDALNSIFEPINAALKQHHCQRAVLVGHNPSFDLNFIKAAMSRSKINKGPFHLFTTFDTATLAGVAYGQTVLLKAAGAAGIEFDSQQAHSALYDAQKTAELFCQIVNQWPASK